MDSTSFHQRQNILGSLQGVRFHFPQDLENGFERAYLAGYRFAHGHPCEINRQEFSQAFISFKTALPGDFEKWENRFQVEWIAEKGFELGSRHNQVFQAAA